MLKYLSDPRAFSGFEETYLRLRAAEGRVLTDEQVRRLPDATGLSESLQVEWKFRKNSIQKLKHYFESATSGTRVLDLGCGNGWAAAALAGNKRLQVTAIDINRLELEQADRVFEDENLQFYFGDIFEEIFPVASFDYIILNASLQYFPDLKKLVHRLFHFLKNDGEIHFVDSPVYSANEIPAAQKRSEQYYSGMGYPDMAAQYHHHSWEELSEFHPERMIDKKEWWQLFKKKNPSHLSWIKIQKRS